MLSISDDATQKFAKRLALLTIVIAFAILFYQLQMSPIPSLADQGDYEYVVNFSGLSFTDETNQRAREDRYFNQPIQEYTINGPSIEFYKYTSMVLPISIAKAIESFIFRSSTLHVQVLGLVFSLLYLFGFFLLIRYAPLKNNYLRMLLAFLSLFILLDGNFTIWFNTLFGEAAITLGILLFIGSALYSIHVSDSQKRALSTFLLIFSAFFLCSSKPQMFACIPFVMIIVLRILFIKRTVQTKIVFTGICLLLTMFAYLPFMSYTFAVQNSTHYNAVFYGILEVAEDKREALTKLGLNPDMEVDAGQNAYQSTSKYNLFGKLGVTEFMPNISNEKLAKYYLTNPIPLWKAMEYTSEKAFDVTTNNLAIYSDNRKTEHELVFDRWTLFTYLMRALTPRNLIFIIVFFGCFIGLSIYEYRKRKSKKERLFIELCWATIGIAVIQFGMGYISNGKADIAKHIYSFNYIYACMLIVSLVYGVGLLCNLINKSKLTAKLHLPSKCE